MILDALPGARTQRHLLDVDGLPRAEILRIIDLAVEREHGSIEQRREHEIADDGRAAERDLVHERLLVHGHREGPAQGRAPETRVRVGLRDRAHGPVGPRVDTDRDEL